MSAQRMICRFERIAESTDAKLKKNPFSNTYEAPEFDTQAVDYARPPSGSKTEARGIRAGKYILNEIVRLCEVIDAYGRPDDTGVGKTIDFGSLFAIYQHISDSVVGYLIRARKHGLLTFQGEMLYTHQDEGKIIRMLLTLPEIRAKVQYSGDPVACIQIK